MIRYSINIPAEKQNLLLDYLKSIGADFKIEKEDFISARASLKKIRLKHGL